MRETKSWVPLVLSCILASFAVGVLFAREAQAQIQVPNPPYPFPKVSELWSLQLDEANYVTVDIRSDGSQISGYGFTVTKDVAGRLPVVTAMLDRFSIDVWSSYTDVFELWQKAEDGYYKRIFFQNSNHPSYNSQGYPTLSNTPDSTRSFGQGLVLQPGSYVFRLPGSAHSQDVYRDTALLGYLARP